MIQQIKLVSGEEILAGIVNENEKNLTVVNPMLIKWNVSDQGRMFVLIPYLLNLEDKVTGTIDHNHILGTFEVGELIEQYYNVMIKYTHNTINHALINSVVSVINHITTLMNNKTSSFTLH